MEGRAVNNDRLVLSLDCDLPYMPCTTYAMRTCKLRCAEETDRLERCPPPSLFILSWVEDYDVGRSLLAHSSPTTAGSLDIWYVP